MTNEILKKYEDTISAVIHKNPVAYTSASGNSLKNTVHCHSVSSKTVDISTYAITNKINNTVSKYIVKITIAINKKNQKSFTVIKNTAQPAKTIHKLLAAKHDEQIKKTQLKNSFSNGAFTKKR